MYKIKLSFEDNQVCVSLSTKNQALRKWHGPFAQLIFDEIIQQRFQTSQSFLLCKTHFTNFLKEISKLYHLGSIHYKINETLGAFNIKKSNYCIAEFLLLYIRMSKFHLKKSELFTCFLDDFPNHNFLKFYETMDYLEDEDLVQAVVINKESVFYDKNPEPHEHFYTVNKDRLYDCNEEKSQLFKSLDTEYKNNVYFI